MVILSLSMSPLLWWWRLVNPLLIFIGQKYQAKAAWRWKETRDLTSLSLSSTNSTIRVQSNVFSVYLNLSFSLVQNSKQKNKNLSNLILHFLTPPSCLLPGCWCQEVSQANRRQSRWQQRWRRKWWPWTMRRPSATSIKPSHPPHSRIRLWSWLKTTSAWSSPTHQRQLIYLSQQHMTWNDLRNHLNCSIVWLFTYSLLWKNWMKHL